VPGLHRHAAAGEAPEVEGLTASRDGFISG